MSNGSELKSPAAKALRAAGFVPLPRWWVKAEDLALIEYMARQHADEVSRIRASVLQGTVEERQKQRQIEAAWKQQRNMTE